MQTTSTNIPNTPAEAVALFNKGAKVSLNKGEKIVTVAPKVTTKYPAKVNDICKAYIDTFNQDAVGLRVSEPMRFVTKVSEVF